MPAKVGIKSCRSTGGCVSFVLGCSNPAAIVFHQRHVVSIDKCWLVIESGYCNPYSPFKFKIYFYF